MMRRQPSLRNSDAPLRGVQRNTTKLITGFAVGLLLTVLGTFTVHQLEIGEILAGVEIIRHLPFISGLAPEAGVVLFTGLTLSFLHALYDMLEMARETRVLHVATLRQNELAAARDKQTESAELHQRTARDLAHARDQLQQAIEAISEGFALFDENDRLVLSKKRFRNMHPNTHHIIQPGVTFEKILRSGLALTPPPDAIGREDKWLSERLEQHRNPSGPYEMQLGDGRWIQISKKRTSDGGCVGVRTDITHRKAVEEELQKRVIEMEDTQSRLERQSTELTSLAEDIASARDAAEKANQTKTDFLATISH